MSGILLPGQEKKPQATSGLEVASGFSRKKDERKPTPPAESAAAAPAAPPPAASEDAAPAQSGAAPAARGGRTANDFLFPPSPAQIQCPNCSTPFVVPIFSIVDLGANPELKQPLLSGQVNLASCPKCGFSGPLSAPLMVHYPEKDFLAVFIPTEARISDGQRQKAIGDLSQALMRRIPTEKRRGYMLQPKYFADWQRFSEKMWEFEGVSAEQLRRQRNQTELLQSMISLANDRKALEVTLNRGRDLVDRTFFAMLDRMVMMASAQGQGEPFVQLRNHLLEMTDTGKQIKAQQERLRATLDTIKADTTRDQLLDTLLNAGGEENGREMMASLAAALSPALDYQFLMSLSERIDQTTDETLKPRMEELRNMIVAVHEQQRQNQQAVTQQVQQVLQELLQAENLDTRLQELAEYIDETFLSVLAANIQQAERRGSKAAAARLQEVYNRALLMIEQGMPPDIRLVNHLLSAESKAEVNQLLEENRDLLTPEFIESLKHLEAEMRGSQRAEIADRLKSLRGQIALRM